MLLAQLTCITELMFLFYFVLVKPNAAIAMVLKSGDGVGSEPVENVMRHVYQNLRTAFTF